MLFLVMGLIFLVSEIQFMLIRFESLHQNPLLGGGVGTCTNLVHYQLKLSSKGKPCINTPKVRIVLMQQHNFLLSAISPCTTYDVTAPSGFSFGCMESVVAYFRPNTINFGASLQTFCFEFAATFCLIATRKIRTNI